MTVMMLMTTSFQISMMMILTTSTTVIALLAVVEVMSDLPGPSSLHIPAQLILKPRGTTR